MQTVCNMKKIYENINRFMPSGSHFYHGKISYNVIEEYLSDENLQYIARHPQGNISLHNIAHKLYGKDQSKLFERIYSLRSSLPARELMYVYIESMQSKNDFFEHIKFNSTQHQGRHLPHSTVWGYQKGYEIKEISLTDGIRSALANDSVPQFAIFRDMANQKINFSFLYLVFEAHAGRILGYLIKNDLINNIMSTNNLLAYIVCNLPAETLLPLLQGIEEIMPGQLADFSDAFGRNLLWYCIYNNNGISWNHPQNPVPDFLIACGCNPDNKNALGISFRYCRINAQTAASYHGNIAVYSNRKCLMDKISSWVDCRVPNSKFGLSKIQKFSRPRADAPLCIEMKKLVADKLRETFWNFAFTPEATLPEEWHCSLLQNIDHTVFVSKPLRETIRLALKSYHHPNARKPYVVMHCMLKNIPEMPFGTSQPQLDDLEYAKTVLQTGLLMYNPLICEYFQKHEPELVKSLKFLYMPQAGSIKNTVIQKAVELDDVNEFARICKENSTDSYAFEVIDAIFRGKKNNITAYLLDENESFAARYPVKELVFYAASQLDDESGTMLLNALENRYPNLLKESLDCWGSNLLYHTIFNKHIRWYTPDCKLVKLLKKCGCRMQQVNKFGIGCMDIQNILNDNDITLREEYLKRTR